MASLNDFRKHPVVDLVLTVAVAIGIAYLVQAFIVKPYRVPSGSMEPTIAIGERIIAARFTFRFSDPSREQIIVFHPNGVGADVYDTDTASDETFVKRLIGMPGETIGAIGGQLYICTGKGPTEGQPSRARRAAHSQLSRLCRARKTTSARPRFRRIATS